MSSSAHRSPLANDYWKNTREIDFEKGFPYQFTEDPNNERNLIPDPLIRDDQAIVVNLTDKGLVILTGCGHAGVINTMNYAKK